jgi:hypothetical protein
MCDFTIARGSGVLFDVCPPPSGSRERRHSKAVLFRRFTGSVPFVQVIVEKDGVLVTVSNYNMSTVHTTTICRRLEAAANNEEEHLYIGLR